MNRRLIVGIGICFSSAGLFLSFSDVCFPTHQCCLPHGDVKSCCPSRMVVGFAPGGGGADLIARLLSQELQALGSRPVVVDNRAGAGGAIAGEIVARAAPTGETLLVGGLNDVLNSALRPKLPYDLSKDLLPVTQLATVQQVLVVNPSIRANNLKEWVALAKARPEELQVASSGSGSVGHLSIEAIKLAAGVRLGHVPYKGAAQLSAAVAAGEVSGGVVALNTALQQIQAGRVRALAILGTQRSPLAPDIPTAKEAGFDIPALTNWYGLFAPAGTPRQVVESLNSQMRVILERPQAKESLIRQGLEVTTSSVPQFASFLQMEQARWSKIARESKVKID